VNDFEVQFKKETIRFLEKLDKDTSSRIFKKIKSMRTNPFPQGTKIVVGHKEKTFRLRVGKYRILYVTDFKRKTVIIIKIDKRESVYDQ